LQVIVAFRALRGLLQFDRVPTDFKGMRKRRLGLAILVLTCLLAGSSCLPRQGTLAFVDADAGDFWSGKAVLVEVSEDQRECRVVVRDATLIIRERWVSCQDVHPRHP
jgi:hypothetical protein